MASNPIIEADAECEPFHGDTIRHGEKDSGPGARVDRPPNSTSLNDKSKHNAKECSFDFLIICSKADEDDARKLQHFIQGRFNRTSNLLSNTVLPTDILEEHLDRTMFTLLYVTEKFTDCEWNRSIGSITHKRTLEEKKKQWTVVPVCTKENSQDQLQLPLRYLPCIEYWREDRDETNFSKYIIDSKEDELSQRRLSTSTKTEQTREKMVHPVAENKITTSAGCGEEAKREDVKAIEERVKGIALNSVLHVDRPSSSSSPLIAVENSTQNDVTVDGAPATFITSSADSGVFSDGDMGVSTHVKVGDNTILNKRNNTNELKPSAETKGSVSKVMKGKLKAEDERRIRHNYVYLKQEIDGKHIVDHLYQRFVISLDDKEEIDSRITKSQRTDKLLTILLNAGPGAAYQVFYDALEKRYPHAAKVLKDTPLQDPNEAREGELN